MTPANTQDWHSANQRYLVAALGMVQETLQAHFDRSQEPAINGGPLQTGGFGAQAELEKARACLPGPAALDTLATALNLSPFEQKILLLCAGTELDARFSQLIAAIQGNPACIHPSFGLAMAVFDDAYWSALAPDAPLRYWQLVTLSAEQVLVKSPLRIDEQVLHYLTGVHYMDERLGEIIKPACPDDFLVASHAGLAHAIVEACGPDDTGAAVPLISLKGNSADKLAVAAKACTGLGLRLHAISFFTFPDTIKESVVLARLWNRTAALNHYALLVDATGMDTADKMRIRIAVSFMEQVQGMLLLSTDGWKPDTTRRQIAFAVPKPTREEQMQLWKTNLGKAADNLNGQLHDVVLHFDLSAKTIAHACREAGNGATASSDKAALGTLVWKACCAHTRPKVDELAQRIEPVAGWDDLVLPEAQKGILQEIGIQVKRRHKVYHDWGFNSKGSRGLGITALFCGESGTGKTMAAEVLANSLRLDLYRIDLSQVVNKYIGETEKNLKRIFDAAEEGGAILLFDEADALFGKRSDVKDSHDRYSNIEVSYLLQRMEAYGGLAILTTNMKSALDKAFLRRIRFVVPFPYPDAQLRARIWKRIFPHHTPVGNLDMEKLSRLNVPGGNIRNIALNAAFWAADEDVPVQMNHIWRAVKSEYTKMEKPLSGIETGGW